MKVWCCYGDAWAGSSGFVVSPKQLIEPNATSRLFCVKQDIAAMICKFHDSVVIYIEILLL